MEGHQSRLKFLCRVCAKTSKKYSHRKDSDVCKPLLLAAVGVDVESEPKEVYPSCVCNKCYLSLQRIKKSKETGVVLKSQLILSSWSPHSDESCPICDDDSSDKHQIKKSAGRPRNDDICHLSREIMREVNNINPPQYSNLSLESSHFLPTPILQSLLCQHCKCIPNRPLELFPCHHLICILCIIKITETHTLTCSCSPVETQIIQPHPVVIELLGSLLLNCPGECGQVITLQLLLQHLQSNCVRRNVTPTPPLSQITVQQIIDSAPESAVVQYTMGLLVEMFIPSSGSVLYKSLRIN